MDGDISVELAAIRKVLEECCAKKVRHILSEHCNTHDESTFMAKCGVDSLQSFDLKITLNENDLECLREINPNKNIGATIMCYCEKRNSVYFRGKTNWMNIIKSPNHSHAVDELQKCWTLGNFKRHLLLHKKYYTVDHQEDNSSNNDQRNDTAQNTSAEEFLHQEFQKLVNGSVDENNTGETNYCTKGIGVIISNWNENAIKIIKKKFRSPYRNERKYCGAK